MKSYWGCLDVPIMIGGGYIALNIWGYGENTNNQLLSVVGVIIGLIFIFGGPYFAYHFSGQEAADEERKRIMATMMPPKISSNSLKGYYPNNWDEISIKVKRRDGYKCGNCGSSTNLHVHHIVPLSKGGTNNLSNLRTLCENCHKRLHPHMK